MGARGSPARSIDSGLLSNGLGDEQRLLLWSAIDCLYACRPANPGGVVLRSFSFFILMVAAGIGCSTAAAAGELEKVQALQSGLDARLSQLQGLCQEWDELQPKAAKKQMRLGMYPKPDACLPEVQQYIRDQVAVMVKRAETGKDIPVSRPMWTMGMAGTDPEKLDDTISAISRSVAEFRAAL